MKGSSQQEIVGFVHDWAGINLGHGRFRQIKVLQNNNHFYDWMSYEGCCVCGEILMIERNTFARVDSEPRHGITVWWWNDAAQAQRFLVSGVLEESGWDLNHGSSLEHRKPAMCSRFRNLL